MSEPVNRDKLDAVKHFNMQAGFLKPEIFKDRTALEIAYIKNVKITE
ncbi:MAG TPA: hypothetical protein PKC58_03675 [Ignavibacteria bacterium]|nr:hypothetical protein [Ignavibacteria bacterium]